MVCYLFCTEAIEKNIIFSFFMLATVFIHLPLIFGPCPYHFSKKKMIKMTTAPLYRVHW